MFATSHTRVGALLLTGLLLVSVGLALVVDPGPFSIDEATYQHMVQSVRLGHGLAVWNGYEEFPSPELTSQWIRPSGDRIYGQYPYLYVVLAAPLQAAFGFRGLFVLNAVAFGLATWLSFRLAQQLLGCRRTALLSAAAFAVASFAGNYAIAAWPHMVSIALALSACTLAASAWQQSDAGGAEAAATSGAGAAQRAERRARWLAFAAGALLGVNAGVRVDSVLIAPVVVAPFALARPIRWRAIAFVTAGALGPLALTAAINAQRWDHWSPLSYGRSIARYVPVISVLVLALALGWMGWHLRHHHTIGQHRRRVLWGAFGALLASFILPSVREFVLAWTRGAWTLLVDLAALPEGRVEAGLSRTLSGGVVYAATLKRALLQSCPHLVVIITLLASFRSDRGATGRAPDARTSAGAARERATVLALLAAPALVVAFYARSTWHGGFSFNLRYFSLCLPFLSILSAHAAIRIAARDERAHALTGVLAFAGAGTLLVSLPVWRLSAEAAEFWLSDAALALVVLTAIISIVWLLRPSRLAALTCTAVASLGAAWSAAAGLGYDSVHAQYVRSANYTLGSLVGEYVKDDSLLFVHYPDPFYSVLDVRRNVRLAIPANDGFRDMVPLANFHLAQGRPVFAVFRQDLWSELEKMPAARRYHLDPILRVGPYSLRRMRARSATAVADGVSAQSTRL